MSRVGDTSCYAGCGLRLEGVATCADGDVARILHRSTVCATYAVGGEADQTSNIERSRVCTTCYGDVTVVVEAILVVVFYENTTGCTSDVETCLCSIVGCVVCEIGGIYRHIDRCFVLRIGDDRLEYADNTSDTVITVTWVSVEEFTCDVDSALCVVRTSEHLDSAARGDSNNTTNSILLVGSIDCASCRDVAVDVEHAAILAVAEASLGESNHTANVGVTGDSLLNLDLAIIVRVG